MSLNDSEKDFIDKFFDYFNVYKDSGVRFFAVALCAFSLFILGLFLAPTFIKMISGILPIEITFLVLSPLDILFNYLKIALFFAFIFAFPVFIYQFGKLKYKSIDADEKINRIIISLIMEIIAVISLFVSYKFLLPTSILLLYGLNFSVVSSTISLSSIVLTFIYMSILVTLVLMLPVMRYLIKNSKFFNYSEMVSFKKPVMIYAGIFTAIIALPIEFLIMGGIFLTFYFWYKILVKYSKSRD